MEPDYEDHMPHGVRKESDLDLGLMQGYFSLEAEQKQPQEDTIPDGFVRSTNNHGFPDVLSKRPPPRPLEVPQKEALSAKNIKRSISSGNVYNAGYLHPGILGTSAVMDVKVEDETDLMRLEPPSLMNKDPKSKNKNSGIINRSGSCLNLRNGGYDIDSKPNSKNVFIQKIQKLLTDNNLRETIQKDKKGLNDKIQGAKEILKMNDQAEDNSVSDDPVKGPADVATDQMLGEIDRNSKLTFTQIRTRSLPRTPGSARRSILTYSKPRSRC